MTMIGATIADFGAAMGLDLDEFPEGGHLALAIEEIGQVHFEHQNEQLLIYVSRPIDVALDRFEVYKSALRSVHFENRLPARVQCALHGEDLVLLAQYEQDEVDQPALERALDALADLHDTVRA